MECSNVYVKYSKFLFQMLSVSILNCLDLTENFTRATGADPEIMHISI